MSKTNQEIVADVAGEWCKDGALSYVRAGSKWYRYRQCDGWRAVFDTTFRADLLPILARVAEKNLDKGTLEAVEAILGSFLAIPESDTDDINPALWLDSSGESIQVTPAPGWVRCRNCLFDVRAVSIALYEGKEIPEGAIKPLDSSLFVPGTIPCNLDLTAACPRWEAFVSESCPYDAKTLQFMFGLSLTYDRSFNVFFIVYGEAGTGKSTALNLLNALNKGVSCSVSLSDFGERFQAYPLTESRLNLVQDMDSVYEGAGSVGKREGVLKSLTAGETIQVERKHCPPERRALTALPVFGSNSLPRFADRSEAIADRMRVIQFPNRFRGTDKQDSGLQAALNKELPGALLWALRGYGELLSSGVKVLPESESGREIKLESIKASRPEILFCEEVLALDPLQSQTTENIYSVYQTYCARNGYKASSSSRVIPEIVKRMGVVKVRARVDGAQKTILRGVTFEAPNTPPPVTLIPIPPAPIPPVPIPPAPITPDTIESLFPGYENLCTDNTYDVQGKFDICAGGESFS